ncbi:MAG: autotransporter outer membrane beta-barrel domain-containing protein [Sutterellaceae bacterium]|nr:autotransporter outer membrane beta-barrel domain-containing protein [Sutterellaceae bacterium]
MSSIIAGTLEVQSSANFLDLENLKVDHLKVNGGDKPSAYVKFDFKDGAGNTVDLESAEFNGKKTTLQLFNANLDLDQVTVTEGSKGYINFKEGTDQTGTVGVVKVNQNAKFDVITEKANSKTTIDSITLEENSTFGGGGDKLLTNNATINVTDITVNGDAQISKVGGLLTNTTLSIDKMEVNKGTLTVASTQKIAGKEFDLTVNEGAKVDIQFSVDAQAFNVYANTLVADSVKVAQTGENTNATVYVGSDLNTKVAREIVNDIHAAVSMDKDYAYEVADGDIYGAIRGKGDTYTQAKNANLTGLGSVTALSTMTWLHEMNSLNKRMGELRDAPQGVGSWVRLYGSEMEYGVQNVQSKNTTIQVGSDISVGDWKVGLAANYTDGESSYDNGSADSKNYGIAIYGSWLAPCGGYLDLIAKYSRLDHDYAMGNMKGNYDNNALNLSVETGYRFEFMEDRVFVEPQLELAYGHISGADYMASNDVRVDLDSYTSFTGRLGVRTGFKFPDNKGSVYARVSGVYDFDGEIDYKASKGDMYDNFHEDLGGAWVEYGIGANFNWTENTYTYVDLERTSGGEVRENYRWNIGLRHVF